jgi:hypothetical protein
VRAWLEGIIETGRHDLPEEMWGYLLGRGMREELVHSLGIGLWRTPQTPPPDEEFAERYYGKNGMCYLEGRLICPCYSPRGDLLGFEGRTWEGEKRITDYRLMPVSRWNPFFLGLTPETMERIWDGADVWIVEGLFDLAPMERVVPKGDVVLATVRAKVSDTHVEFLRRYVRQMGQMVHILYDNDETGQRQTYGYTDEHTGKPKWGAIQRLEWVRVPCRPIKYDGGKDPGEIWDQGGEEGLRRVFSRVI